MIDVSLQLLSPYAPGWGGVLLTGALATVKISLLSYIGGIAIGVAGAFGKINGSQAVKSMLACYTALVRALPELILIVALYYAGTEGLNTLLRLLGVGGLEINGFAASVVVLSLVQGAYMTELFRGVVQAIPQGQLEAAAAFGMPSLMRFRRILLPAALPIALPGLSNLWMVITKDSALIAIVGYQELALATKMAAASTKHYFLFFSAAFFIYWIINYVSGLLFLLVERQFRRGQPTQA